MTDLNRLRQLAGIQEVEEGEWDTADAPDWVDDYKNMDYETQGTHDHVNQIMNIWNRWSGNQGAELYYSEENESTFTTVDMDDEDYEGGYGSNEKDAQGNDPFQWTASILVQRHSSGKRHLNLGTSWIQAGDYPNSATHLMTQLIKEINPDWTSIVIDQESSGGYWPAFVKKLKNASLEYDGSGGR